jgi:hypothetical protein
MKWKEDEGTGGVLRLRAEEVLVGVLLRGEDVANRPQNQIICLENETLRKLDSRRTRRKWRTLLRAHLNLRGQLV